MKFKRKLSIALAFSLVWLAAAAPSFAYFNRGAVELSPGSTSVSVAAGSSASVSVGIDPIKEDQLPGCGMAECPQTCGSSGCLNENGECTCAGTAYKTYYSTVSVSSSNQSVASASYSNGAVTIKGVSAGTAVITVTGSMRQYTDSSVSINVNVTGGSGAAGAGPAGSNFSVGKNVPAEGLNVQEVSGAGSDASSSESENSGENAADGDGSADITGELRNTKKGLYRIVELTDKTDVKSCFEQAIKEKSHIVFQNKSGENVKWSWTFNAADISPEDAQEIDLGIEASAEIPQSVKDAAGGVNAYYLTFKHSGELPAPAEIYINVSEVFAESTVLDIYAVDAGTGNITETDSTANAENGYATFSIEKCSDFLLTDAPIDAKAADTADAPEVNGGASRSGTALPAVAAVVVIILIAGATGYTVYRKKKK